MKNIGIITFHNAHNYGAVLQVYALEKFLEKRYNVSVINYRNKNIEDAYKLLVIKTKHPIKIIKRVTSACINYRNNKKRYDIFNSFINNRLNLTKKIDSIEELQVLSQKFDCYIVGSDQIWNTNIVGELSDIYTLNFQNSSVRKISYAASIGKSTIEENYKEEFKNKISQIDYISVREENAKKELEKIIDKPITVVLDPTLLLVQNDWNQETQSMQAINEKYILAYVVQLDEEYIKIVNDLSEKTGLKVIHFGKRNPGYKNVLKSAYTEGPLEFINYIKNAEYVVATSFHATVFSIIFHKKFFVIPHKKNGSRITNLVDKLGIENRTFNTLEEFQGIDYNFETNWDSIEKKLEEERKKSLNWLENAINTGKDNNE